MQKSKLSRRFQGLFVGLASLISTITANADMQGKPVLATGNNPYNWQNLPTIVSNITDVANNQTGSYSNSFRVRCKFNGFSTNENAYTMNVFGNDGQLYASTKIPTNGRVQCDMFLGSPSLSDSSKALNSGTQLYLSFNYTNGLAYALPFQNLIANSGVNFTLNYTNSQHQIIGSIDSDSDGFRNDEETFVGTDPYNSSDFFKITSITRNNSFLRVRWNGSPNTLVDICGADNSFTNEWKVVKPNVFNGSATVTMDKPLKFYRVKAKGRKQ
jgi:hypothetical protein